MKTPSKETRTSQITAAVLVFTWTALLRIPFLGLPFERDEGEYATIAWRLASSELPYRDWFNQKPPGIFWVYRMALGLPGDPVRAVHWVNMVFAMGTAWVMFILCRRFLPKAWAMGAALLLALLSADPRIQGFAANTEGFMLLPLLVATWAFWRYLDTRSIGHALFCGLSLGVATLFKQVAAVHWVLLAAALPFLSERKEKIQDTLRFASVSLLGVLALWLPVLAFFHLRHGLEALLDDVFWHNFKYAGALPWKIRLLLFRDTLGELSLSQTPVWILACVLPFRAFRVPGLRRPTGFGLGWAFSSLIAVSASGYFFPHYFQQILPALAFMAMMGAHGLSEAWGDKGLHRALAAVVLMVLPAFSLLDIALRSPADAMAKVYPGNYFAQMPTLGRRISEISKSEDRIFIFGSEPELFFYARRASATRYILLNPLYGPYSDALERQETAIQDILKAKPAVVVYYPLALFKMPGSKHRFSSWSLNYVQNHGVLDSFLSLDPTGQCHFYCGQDGDSPRLPKDHKYLALVFRVKDLSQ